MKTNLAIIAILLGLSEWLHSTSAQPQEARLLMTFTNPNPVLNGFFGSFVSAMGSDRVIVSANGGGGAYLFDTTGRRLTTFTFSEPGSGFFGDPAVAVGDRVVVSDYGYGTTAQNGRAYLFDTNGVLLITFRNPNPARVQAFGLKLAAMGNDRVLICGAADFSKGAPYQGAVYLFQTNGALLTTFTNPYPSSLNGFGESAAALGNDRVILGAYRADTGAPQAGVAYLYHTNGALLTTFTNPAPLEGDFFGYAVAAAGDGQALISADAEGSTLETGGAAYLFSTNGTVAATFRNPTPHAGEYFGSSIAPVGNARVLIGAYGDDSTGFRSGSAYLFHLDGTLLNTFTNPTPKSFDSFGWSVSALGKDQVVISASFDDTGATDAGAVYLFDLPYPSLNIKRQDDLITLGWNTLEVGLMLQEAGHLGASTVWSNSANLVSSDAGTNLVQQDIATTNRFFRLHRL